MIFKTTFWIILMIKFRIVLKMIFRIVFWMMFWIIFRKMFRITLRIIFRIIFRILRMILRIICRVFRIMCKIEDNIQYTNLNNIKQNFQDLFGKLFRNIYVLMIMIIMDFLDISCMASHFRQFWNIRAGFVNNYMNFKKTSWVGSD